MGGVKDFLFGKKAKGGKSESGNLFKDQIMSAYGGSMDYTGKAGDAAWQMLNGGPGGFADSGGFNFLLDKGTDSVNSNFYARGLGESGAAMKALEGYRSGLASTYLTQYMDQLFKLGQMGLGAGGLVSSAGQYSKGDGGSGGKQGALPGLISAAATAGAFSDIRLKENVDYVGKTADGLNVIEFNYDQNADVILPKGRFRGVIAQEVEKVNPTAVSTVSGYLFIKDPALAPKRID